MTWDLAHNYNLRSDREGGVVFSKVLNEIHVDLESTDRL